MSLAPKWTPRGFAQRYRTIFREHGDVLLCMHIAAFIFRAPRLIARQDLRTFIQRLRNDRAPRATQERIVRLRTFLLGCGIFATANTCYVRALTLYRFLDAPSADLTVHFGVEHRTNGKERLRGHAWVSCGNTIIEGPPAALEGRIREIPLNGAR